MLSFEYDEQLPSLRRLIRLSNRAQWTLEDIDWSRKLSSRGGEYERVLEWHGIWRYDYVQCLPPKKAEALARQMVACEFSQILHGEQAAMMLAGQLTSSVEDLDARIFASSQARDEARHVEAVRDLVQRLGPIYPCGAVLKANLDNLLECDLWPKQVLGLQLFLEARALLSFRQHLLFVKDPVFRDVVMRIERDEAHHVAFGVQYLKNGVDALTPEERTALLEYTKFLDENLWNMTQQAEFRAAFEEVDLDFDECFAEAPATFTAPRLGPKAQKSIEDMYGQFSKWFHNAVRRVGLAEALEAPKSAEDAGELATEGEVSDVLPWVKASDDVLNPSAEG